MENDVILVDKPVGITSFDVIRILRKKLGIRKMGHAGTLDPLASGLMIIGVEDGTKRLAEYIKLPKVYEATIRIGERYSTGDLEGELLEKVDASEVAEKQIREVFAELVGLNDLPVPVYSAIKRDGEALYKKARRGEKVEPPIKRMEVRNALLTQVVHSGEFIDAQVVFEVGSGTYIRSLAEELGRRLGYPATLAALRRTHIGTFSVLEALSLE